MNKIVITLIGAAVGVVVEKKYGVANKVKSFAKDAWDKVKQTAEECKAKVDENLKDLKDGAEEAAQ